MKAELDPLVELAVWGILEREKDLELILLKGHLLLENVVNIVLERCKIKGYKNFSFHRKVLVLEKIEFEDYESQKLVVSALKQLNKLRNKLAHEYSFKVENGELESWSLSILEKLKGTKYSKFTFRTKIVHSFSILAINILKLA